MNVGFITLWYERGGPYLALMMRNALAEAGHKTFILTRTGVPKPIDEEWFVPNITVSGKKYYLYYNPSEWVKKHKLDAVIAVAKAGWKEMESVKNSGVKTIQLLLGEFADPFEIKETKKRFDYVISSTDDDERIYHSYGYDTLRIHWGVNLNTFKPEKVDRNYLQFFHPGGHGGVGGRRATSETIQAFRKANVRSSKLIVTNQIKGKNTIDSMVEEYHGNFKQSHLAKMYNTSDVAILPSKWEGLGLTFIESLAAGLFIITVDAPPMRDYVIEGQNGLLCKCSVRKQTATNVFRKSAEVDVDDLVSKIRLANSRPSMVREAGKKSRQIAEEYYDWNKNKKGFVNSFERIMR